MQTQLDRLCESRGVTITIGQEVAPPQGWTPGTIGHKVTLKYKGRRLTSPFYQGPAICKDPTPADVLRCLIMDTSAGEMTFEEYCGDMGEDFDSRKAEATWKLCKKMATKVRRLLGEDFETFAQAEH